MHTAGSGDPVVFLHGAGGLEWDAFLDGLAERFTVHAPEHPGTTPGDPDGIRALDHLWDLVLYYDELFDALGVDAPAVIGHSFGGMVAAEVAATFRRRVSKLVLINALGLWRDDAPDTELPRDGPLGVRARSWSPTRAGHSRRGSSPHRISTSDAGQTAVIQMTWSLACTGKFFWPIPDRGLDTRLHRISAPTLVVWGHRDNLVKSVYADEFAQRISDARVEVLENAAHFPHLEQTERTLALVGDFLAGD